MYSCIKVIHRYLIPYYSNYKQNLVRIQTKGTKFLRTWEMYLFLHMMYFCVVTAYYSLFFFICLNTIDGES